MVSQFRLVEYIITYSKPKAETIFLICLPYFGGILRLQQPLMVGDMEPSTRVSPTVDFYQILVFLKDRVARPQPGF